MKPAVLTLGLTAIAALLVAAAPTSTPATPQPLPVKADWQARAAAWFKDAPDTTAKRKAMRQITKALKQPCRYCHTPDWKGYTDKLLISQQMMALSAEHDVPCADCHAGKTELTALGEKARPMFALARKKVVDCGHCHVPQKKFKALTPEGEAHKAKK
jgi:nitrate/TMAO reductase-like tetraheme cytochrome c subunit